MKPERSFIGTVNVSKTTYDTCFSPFIFKNPVDIYITYDAMFDILCEFTEDKTTQIVYHYDYTRDIFISRTRECWFIALRINHIVSSE
jgi:hypothetical protein